MKKITKKLALSTQTLRTLSDDKLRNIAGGLEPTSVRKCATITCNEECDSYQCFDTLC